MSRIEQLRNFFYDSLFREPQAEAEDSSGDAATPATYDGDALELFLGRTGLETGQRRLRLRSFAATDDTNRALSAADFDLDTIQGVAGNRNVTPEFRRAVAAMAERLGTRPEYIMAVMSFETGGTFSPSKENRSTHATGLIQFMPDTARGMLAEDGREVTAARAREIFAAMTPLEQLRYVERYFAQRKFNGRLGTLEGTYTAVLSGQARSNGDDVVFAPGRNYNANSGLDWNHDGQITAAEAANPVAFRLFGGVTRAQTRLRELGYYDRRPDGEYGPLTRAALERFQTERRLPVTGLMNEQTGRALFDLQAAQTDTTTNDPNDLRRGSNGPEVERMQDQLVALGHLTAADKNTGPGIFGRRTESALKAFQRANHLAESGVYDEATRNAVAQLTEGVRRGSANREVVTGLQARLVALNYMTPAEAATGPGIFGQRTENALKAFQRSNGLEPSGVLDAATYRKLHSADAVSNGTRATGNHFTVDEGVVLSDDARERIGRIADEYFRRTGNNLRVTDGTRTAHDQARQIYNKIQLNDTGIYRDQTSLAEIRRAYDAGVRAGNSRAQIIDDMSAVIQGQVNRGVYISRHLRAGAVDVSVRGMTTADEREFRASVAAADAGTSVLRETRPPHFHLQF
ncbi:MAG TPA: peptidoglycan-binding protein [Pyrinomonadaceae bacterium]|jgi:peptidoglycan hydrolase-like protein with peptidoglycan-binding domain|nr:peptidoglycan-binding protein [Pyrinomonadaceae bacterium]